MINQCITGDSLAVLPTLEAGSVQCCVTSPPYYGLRDYGVDGQIGLEKTPDEYVAHLVAVFREVRRVLRDDGVLFVNLGDSYFSAQKGSGGPSAKQDSNVGSRYQTRKFERNGLKPKDLIGIPWMVAFALRADGWYLRQDLIWAKPNPMPESVRDRCTKSHEYLFLLAKSDRYYFDAAAIAESATSSGPQNSFARKAETCPSPVSPMQHREEREPIEYSGKRNKRSVWTIATQPYSAAHFATFPPALIEPCILAGSRPGDVVLDPFMGSGTTAMVAQNLGRQWIGVELNPTYIELQGKRTQQQGLVLA